ncbi:unnamed protein product [Kuraishia capsulata CBS 1993]|uniref:DUS-like FMN-binding domain-containing protein n=1 Tax=Kuraishia capsulata CBS 1993 TaxID=1382522 RepID=W6MU98_9ASCO|nr:uncharacterized protein KUCA_T00005008001 [Kuraishia capsulata CBS 1993]CDK29022.1 unnamed protein product [Kuraishia capsulata CBS 1993]
MSLRILRKMVNYKSAFVLAPMVRIGDLPTRLLSLRYGADLVWGPEIIDKKLLVCERVENKKLGTVDFITQSNNDDAVSNLVFRTFPALETNKLIFQMGTADADLAVQAAKTVIKDVSGIDINAGCPKHFSIHSGMGAALLSTPDLLVDILTRLVNEVGKPNEKPISVKIRIFDDKDKTLELVSRLLDTGIANLTVHCRTKTMRNREKPIRDFVPDIRDMCRAKNVTFIINGDVKDYKEYAELQNVYGEDVGCMVASAAELNPSCFRKEGPLPWMQVCRDYADVCEQFETYKSVAKYCMSRLIPKGNKSKSARVRLSAAKSLEEIVTLFRDELNDEGELVQEDSEKGTEKRIDKASEKDTEKDTEKARSTLNTKRPAHVLESASTSMEKRVKA